MPGDLKRTLEGPPAAKGMARGTAAAAAFGKARFGSPCGMMGAVAAAESSACCCTSCGAAAAGRKECAGTRTGAAAASAPL